MADFGMSFVTCYGYCYTCHKPISFNPVKVPSVRVDGNREPVCRTCIENANPERVARGLAAIEIADDAYEACDESALE